jgi:hypothetical protein
VRYPLRRTDDIKQNLVLLTGVEFVTRMNLPQTIVARRNHYDSSGTRQLLMQSLVRRRAVVGAVMAAPTQINDAWRSSRLFEYPRDGLIGIDKIRSYEQKLGGWSHTCYSLISAPGSDPSIERAMSKQISPWVHATAPKLLEFLATVLAVLDLIKKMQHPEMCVDTECWKREIEPCVNDADYSAGSIFFDLTKYVFPIEIDREMIPWNDVPIRGRPVDRLLSEYGHLGKSE